MGKRRYLTKSEARAKRRLAQTPRRPDPTAGMNAWDRAAYWRERAARTRTQDPTEAYMNATRGN